MLPCSATSVFVRLSILRRAMSLFFVASLTLRQPAVHDGLRVYRSSSLRRNSVKNQKALAKLMAYLEHPTTQEYADWEMAITAYDEGEEVARVSYGDLRALIPPLKRQKAKAGTGIGQYAINLLKQPAHAKKPNAELAKLVRAHFAKLGVECATSATCIGWYKSKLKTGEL
jgi:hypothetical protein